MITQDTLHRFLFEERGIRGEWIQLTTSWQTIQQNQKPNYTSKAAHDLLGQALAAVALLSATIKFEGSLILQIQGDGAIKTLVAQSTHDKKIRGLIRNNDDVAPPTTVSEILPDLFGQGRLVLTISPNQGESYQGIVALDGKNLATALEGYFKQSEQLKTRLWLFVNEFQAAGFLLQEIPGKSSTASDWQHIETLANTLTERELMTLECDQFLYRLFHEEKIRLFDAESVQSTCVCSRQRIEGSLKSLGQQELQDILNERDTIEVGCEFCNNQYLFDKIDIAQLFLAPERFNVPHTQH